MRFLLLLLPLLLLNCAEKNGSFAFFLSDESELTRAQQKFYQPRIFRIYKPPISFPRDKNIWFVYNPAEQNYEKPYAISMSKKSLGWIEFDLKNQLMRPEKSRIIDKLSGLEVGHYLLRIAHEEKVLDRVQFEVTGRGSQEIVDYDAPVSTDTGYLGGGKVEDDIELYSR